MTIQYQDCRGRWNDCEDREDEFITLCMKNNGPPDPSKRPDEWSDESWNRIMRQPLVPKRFAIRDATRDEVIAALATGAELRYDSEDWYSNCRQKPKPRPQPKQPKMVKCDCGHTVTEILVMNASVGTSCPDCYDEMS